MSIRLAYCAVGTAWRIYNWPLLYTTPGIQIVSNWDQKTSCPHCLQRAGGRSRAGAMPHSARGSNSRFQAPRHQACRHCGCRAVGRLGACNRSGHRTQQPPRPSPSRRPSARSCHSDLCKQPFRLRRTSICWEHNGTQKRRSGCVNPAIEAGLNHYYSLIDKQVAREWFWSASQFPIRPSR